MGSNLVGKAIAEDTNEIKLKWLQHQIADRKQGVKQLQLDIENLTMVRLPQLEEMVLKKQNEINALLGQQTEAKTIQVQ